jgi:hypothetical protein
MERLNALQIQLDTLQGHLQARNISPDHAVYGLVTQLTADVARALTGLGESIDVAQIEAEVGGAAERVRELLAPQSPRSGDRKGGGDPASPSTAGSGAASPQSDRALSPPPDEPDESNLISVSIPGTPVLQGVQHSLSNLLTNSQAIGGGGGGGGSPRANRSASVDSGLSSGIASQNSSAPGSVPVTPRRHAAVPISRGVSPSELNQPDPAVQGFRLLNELKDRHPESESAFNQIRSSFMAAMKQLHANPTQRQPHSAPVSRASFSSSAGSSSASSTSSSSSESSSSSSESGPSQSSDPARPMP